MNDKERAKHHFRYARLVADNPELTSRFGHTPPVLRARRRRKPDTQLMLKIFQSDAFAVEVQHPVPVP